jgi:hypothetical protein
MCLLFFCVALCAAYCLSLVLFCVLYRIVEPLPPGKNSFVVQLNNNKNSNNNNNNNNVKDPTLSRQSVNRWR